MDTNVVNLGHFNHTDEYSIEVIVEGNACKDWDFFATAVQVPLPYSYVTRQQILGGSR
jgi:hypothetical protein